MIVLALETSGFGGTIAVLEDQQVLGHRVLDASRRHAQTLVPEIQLLLSDVQLRPADCQLLAVSVGPGSFTGLRVGITCAKTIAYVSGAAIAAVPTFAAIAAGCPADVHAVDVVMNAQRQELFLERFFRQSDTCWESSAPLSIVRSADWQSALLSDQAVTGPGLEGISTGLETRCQVLPSHFWQPDAAWVGCLGWQQFQRNELTDCWSLLPLYVRKSAAEEKWDAQHVPSPAP